MISEFFSAAVRDPLNTASRLWRAVFSKRGGQQECDSGEAVGVQLDHPTGEKGCTEYK